jgi:hypothetical protein
MLRKKLRDLYTQMEVGGISKDAINVLVKQVIPFSGFSGGSIFTIDPGTMHLVPRLKFGEVKLMDVRSTDLQHTSDPIATAFSCSSPIVESNEASDTETNSYICGALGNLKKVGVLYLEVPKSVLTQTDSNLLIHYKAIRQTLSDCLNLS